MTKGLPWFRRKRCETGDGDPQNMECMVCGAAFGEVCRQPAERIKEQTK